MPRNGVTPVESSGGATSEGSGGGAWSRMTTRLAVVTLPTPSVATSVRVLEPSARDATASKAPFVTVTGLPLSVRVTGVTSVTIPITCTVEVTTWVLLSGEVMVRTGGTGSTALTCTVTVEPGGPVSR